MNNFRQKSEKKAIEARELRQKNNVPNMAVSHYVPALKEDLYKHLFPVSGSISVITIVVNNARDEDIIPITIKYVYKDTIIEMADNIMLGDNYIEANIKVNVGGILSISASNINTEDNIVSNIFISFIVGK